MTQREKILLRRFRLLALYVCYICTQQSQASQVFLDSTLHQQVLGGYSLIGYTQK